MRRTLLSWLAGIVIGSGVTLAIDHTTMTTYDYSLSQSEAEASVMVNTLHWEVSPNQPNPLFLRRPRSH